MGLALAWTGCAQVFGIDDWNAGTGGQGGEGASSAASMTTTTSSGSGVQAVAVSAASGSGSGGQGGGDTCDGVCVSPVPTGWQGYVAATMLGKDTPLPDCDVAWPSQTDWKTGMLNGPPASCSACNCSDPMGGHCNLTQVGVAVYNDGTCTLSLGTSPVTTQNCTAIGLLNGLTSFKAKLVGSSLPSQSYCTADGGNPAIPPAYFDKHARLCGDPGISTGCANGRQCLPAPPPAFPGLCIYQTVNDGVTVACPNGFSPAPDFYSGLADSRGCTACTCGPPVAQTCEMSAQITAGTTCNPSAPPIYPGTCNGPFATANLAASVMVSAGTPKNGTCNPSVSSPTGAASGTGRTVVCCLP
jgi:hypothetical protein